MNNLLITGGLGFIGSHVVEHFSKKYPNYNIYLLDANTYASNKEFLSEITNHNYNNVTYINGDIRNSSFINFLVADKNITYIIHLAAESHVDNSIENPNIFVETNVNGTVNLLNAALKHWKLDGSESHLFYHISTDEVYGSLEHNDPAFVETTSYNPKSPYSASKASSDHFVRVYGNTYNLPYIISNCSNNYGERQHKEKLLPKTISNLIQGKKIPVYGNGTNIRDWLYVKDHVDAIDSIFHFGRFKETYNIGGDSEFSNIDLLKIIITNMYEMKLIGSDDFNLHIQFVEDRKGHDFRYAINHDKLTKELGWKPKTNITNGLVKTIEYYVNNSK